MKKIKSINLGGWFVLERWMTPTLFKDSNIDGNDETRFCEQAQNKEETLLNHHKTWITREDIEWMKDQGINLVRIPVPWWLFGNDVYYRSVETIDQALKMINEVGMDFMLDLHTAPGCQNGFDNGGIQGVMDWHKEDKNIEKTIEILEVILKRYIDIPHFHSIQLLNEPFVTIDIKIIQDFYQRAYNRLRKISKDKIIVMHDAFRLHEWKDFFTENKYENVILDTHMYQCFDGNMFPYTIEQHEEEALKRTKRLLEVEKYVPVIVGEWSLGLRPNEHINDNTIDDALSRYATAQFKAMNACTGHTFWSYKVEENYSGWNFRNLVDRGIIKMEEFLK